MADAKKKLELEMSLKTDVSQSTKAMKELTAEIDKANKARQQLQEREKYITGGQYARDRLQQEHLSRMENRAMLDAKYGRFGGGIAQAGGDALGAARGAAGYLAGGAVLIQTVAEVNKAWHQLDNSMLTTREKITGFAGAIPIIGSALEGLTHSVMNFAGRLANPEQAKRIEEMRLRSPIEMGEAQAWHERRMRAAPLLNEVAGATFNRQAIQAFPTLASGNALLRGGVGGITGAFLGVGLDSVDPRLKASLEAVQSARQDAHAAQLAVNAAQAAVNQGRGGMRSAMAGWRGRRDASEASLAAAMGGDRSSGVEYGRSLGMGNFGIGLGVISGWLGVAGSGSQQNLQENYLREVPKHTAAQQQLAEQEQRILDLKQKQLTAAQKQHDLARSQTDLMRSQAQVLSEQIARVRGGGREFGMLDAFQQGDVLTAARKFKSGGREAVTPDELQALMSNTLTRDLVGQRSERDAEMSPAFKALLEVTGQRKASDLQAELDKLNIATDLKIQLDKEQFAKTMEESLKKLNLAELLTEIVTNQWELKMRDPSLANLGRRANLGQ